MGFQEYLAARSYAEERKPFIKFEPHLDNGNWEEVILLTAGHLFETSVGRLAEDFLKELLRRYQAAPEQWNRLELCLHAATEAVEGLIPEELLGKIKAIAIDALTCSEMPFKERVNLGFALGRLGDPRLDILEDEYWVTIPSGEFNMGCKEGDQFEMPIHRVTITKNFRMGRFPITNSQFRKFMDVNGYAIETYWSAEGKSWLKTFEYWFEIRQKILGFADEMKEHFRPTPFPKYWDDPRFNAPNQPVVGISWYEAEAFCTWLTLQESKSKVKPSWWKEKYCVRLPTEAQWEYAARGREGCSYPWGKEEPNENRCNYNQRLSKTNPVGIYPLGGTTDGLLEMAGNVWEWCLDPWDPDAYKRQSSGIHDPVCKNEDPRYIARGGSWGNPLPFLASSI